jgi:hypothetical protein
MAMTLLLALTAVTCNRRSPLPNDAGLIVPSPVSVPSTDGAPLALFGISVNPPGVFGTAPAAGVAILNHPASDGGVTVTLASGDPSIVSVPPAVFIPAGADRALFSIATRTVAADQQVQITGSGAAGTAAAPLSVWAVLPTFLSWVSEPGDPIGRGGFARLTPPGATFNATGSDTGVGIQVSQPGPGGDSFRIDVAPATGRRLQVGTYDDAAGIADATHPRMDVVGLGTVCGTASGRFEIREFGTMPNPPFSTPVVARFDATFEYRCRNATGAIRGEIRYTASAR